MSNEGDPPAQMSEEQQPQPQEPAAPAAPEAGRAEGSASFLRAARAGDLEKVLELLRAGTDINTSNANGLNSLHLASKEGHSEVVRELIKRQAQVDAATRKGNTALHIASLAGQSLIVTILVENGANVNVQSVNGFTPLYMAAQENHEDVVRYLLNHGANQALSTEDGFTPLAVALQQGHDRVVAVLLENDAKGKVRLPALHIAAKKDDTKAATLLLQNEHNPDVTSKSGFTPLHIAAHYGHENVGKLLLDKGANVNYQARHNISPLHVATKWGRTNMANLLLARGAIIDSRTKDLLTPLHCAARSGHDQVVDLLVVQGAPISAKTKNGLAPLHMAAQGDHVDAARTLLYHRAPVDDVTVDYLTPLHVAAHCGHVRVAKLLLDRSADPNARALNGFTPLHIACKKNRIKVVELLLKYRAAIEATTESGLTPLHVAAFMGAINIVIYLLQQGANPDVETVRGETPLHLAARANQTDVVRVLIRNGAKVDAQARELQTPLHIASRLGNTDIVVLLLQAGANSNATTRDNYSPLHIAAKEGQEEVAGILLDHNADKTLMTKKGFTPLHLASKYGNLEVVRLLLERGTPVDIEGKNQVTPLHVAAHYNNDKVAMLLLENGASAKAAAKNGYTPLHIAAKKNQMEIASTLLHYKADPNAKSRAGFTPLHLATQEGHKEISGLLIENGSDVGAKANNGLTAMHLCAQEDHVPVAQILHDSGAEINSKTNAGYTPLHVACHFGQLNMVKFLVEHGADVGEKTRASYTPLHQAAQQGHNNCVRYLLENGASPNEQTATGQTPLSIAQRLGYVSVVETLRTVTETTVITETTTVDDRYKPQNPEAMNETMFSESEDEGQAAEHEAAAAHAKDFSDNLTQALQDSTGVHMIHTGEQLLQRSQELENGGAIPKVNSGGVSPEKEFAKIAPVATSSPIASSRSHPMGLAPRAGSISNQFQQQPLSTIDAADNIEELVRRAQANPIQASANYENGAAMLDRHADNVPIGHHVTQPSFLISFLVDARGGAMRGCRHSGVRIIVPPRKASQPIRVTCRYLRKDKLAHPPPLSEGEELASRILEMAPAGAKFLGPVILEVPHFASLRDREREIVILRSDDGQHWKEHQLEATEDAVQEVLNESFDAEDLAQLDDLHTPRITRILTNDFPMYFAVVTRVRQEVHCVGPEGGVIISSVVPRVQAIFPDGSLTKTIKVSVQAQPVPQEMVTRLHGNRVAVSPIVTVEPRRRKFHKPITLCIPLPQSNNKGMLTQYSGQQGQEPPTLRLLCSITGGSAPAQWEDITGTTQLTFTGDEVSFTTTVSARFWLMDCQTPRDAARMAQEVYNEAISIPYMAKFAVFARRTFPVEGQLRVFCMTDDKEDKTLEKQEHFKLIAKSRDVEVLKGKHQFLEFSGNLVPITKSGDQLSLFFLPFQENRLAFMVKTRSKDDTEAATEGRIGFMAEPKIRSDALPPQQPICTLAISLPEYTGEVKVTPPPKKDGTPFEQRYQDALNKELPEFVHQNVLKGIGADWPRLGRALEVPHRDIQHIRYNYPGQECKNTLKIWIHLKKDEANQENLDNALRQIGRDDIVRSIAYGEPEALINYSQADSPSQKREPIRHYEDVPAATLVKREVRTEDIVTREPIEPHHVEQTTVMQEPSYSAPVHHSPVPEEPEPEEEAPVAEMRTVVRTERHVHDSEDGPVVEERTITTTYEDDVAVNENIVDRTVPLNEEEQAKWEELNRLADEASPSPAQRSIVTESTSEPLPEDVEQSVESESHREDDGTIVTTTVTTSHISESFDEGDEDAPRRSEEHDEASGEQHDSGTTQKKETSEEGFTNEDGSVVVSKKMTRVVTTTRTTLPGEGEEPSAPESPVESLGSVKDRIAKFEQLKDFSPEPSSSGVQIQEPEQEEPEQKESEEPQAPKESEPDQLSPVGIVITPHTPVPPEHSEDLEKDDDEPREPLELSEPEHIAHAQLKDTREYSDEELAQELHPSEEHVATAEVKDTKSYSPTSSDDERSQKGVSPPVPTVRHAISPQVASESLSSHDDELAAHFVAESFEKHDEGRVETMEQTPVYRGHHSPGQTSPIVSEHPIAQEYAESVTSHDEGDNLSLKSGHEPEIARHSAERVEEEEEEGLGDFAKKAGMIVGGVIAAPVALAAVGVQAAYDALKKDDDEEGEAKEKEVLTTTIMESPIRHEDVPTPRVEEIRDQEPSSPAPSSHVESEEKEIPHDVTTVTREAVGSPEASEKELPHVVETTTTTTVTREYQDGESPVPSEKHHEEEPEAHLVTETTTTTTVTREYYDEPELIHHEAPEQESYSPTSSPTPSSHVESELPVAESPNVVETTTTTTVTREYEEEPEEERSPSTADSQKITETTTTTTITRDLYDEEGVHHEKPVIETTTTTVEFEQSESERSGSPSISEKATYSPAPLSDAERQEALASPMSVKEPEPHLVSETITTTTVTREFYDEPEEEKTSPTSSPAPSSHVESERPIAESPVVSDMPHVVETTTTTAVTREYEEEPIYERRSPSPAPEHHEPFVIKTTTTTTVTRDLHEEQEDQESQAHSPAPSSHLESEHEKPHVVETITTTTVTREFHDEEEEADRPDSDAEEEPAHWTETITTTTSTREVYEEPEEEKQAPLAIETSPNFIVSGVQADGTPIVSGAVSPVGTTATHEEEPRNMFAEPRATHQFYDRPEQGKSDDEDDESDGEGFGRKALGFGKKAGMVAGAVVAAPVALAAVGAKVAYDALKKDDDEEDVYAQRAPESPAASDKDVPQFEQEHPITHEQYIPEATTTSTWTTEYLEDDEEKAPAAVPVAGSPAPSEKEFSHVVETTTTTTVTREYEGEAPESPVPSEKDREEEPEEPEAHLVTETTTTTTVTREYYDEPELIHHEAPEQESYSPTSSPTPSSHVESERPVAESPTTVTREEESEERSPSPADSQKHFVTETTTTTTVTRDFYDEPEEQDSQAHSPAPSSHVESEVPHVTETITTTTVTREFHDEPEEGSLASSPAPSSHFESERPVAESPAVSEKELPHVVETTTTTTVTREFHDQEESERPEFEAQEPTHESPSPAPSSHVESEHHVAESPVASERYTYDRSPITETTITVTRDFDEAHEHDDPDGVESSTIITVTRDYEHPEDESEKQSESEPAVAESEHDVEQEHPESPDVVEAITERQESPVQTEKDTYSPVPVTEGEYQEESEPHLIRETTTTTTVTREFYDEPEEEGVSPAFSPAPSSHVESERPIADSPVISEKELPHVVETTTTTTVTREYEEEPEERSPSPADSQKHLVTETTTTVTREFYEDPEDQESQAYSPAPSSHVESEQEKPQVVETTTTTTVTREFYEDEPHHEVAESPAHREIAESPMASSPAPSSHVESERPVAESTAISEKELPHVVETTTTTTVTREFYEDEPHHEISESPAAHYFHEQPEHEAESPVPTEQAPLLSEQAHPEHDDDESDGEGFGSKMLGFAKKAGMVAGAVVAAPVALAAVGAKSAYDALKRDDGEEDEEEQEALLRDVHEQRAPESPAVSDKDVPHFEQEHPITHSPSEPAEQEPVQESPVSSEPHHVTETTTTTTVTREFYDEPESPVASEKEFHQPSESVGSPVESERSLPHVVETTTTTTVTREFDEEAAPESPVPSEGEPETKTTTVTREIYETPVGDEHEHHYTETTTTTVTRHVYDEPEDVGGEQEPKDLESPEEDKEVPHVVETTTTTTVTREYHDDDEQDHEPSEHGAFPIETTTTTTVTREFYGEEPEDLTEQDAPQSPVPSEKEESPRSESFTSVSRETYPEEPHVVETTTTTTITREYHDEPAAESPVPSEKDQKESVEDVGSPVESEKSVPHVVETTTTTTVTREFDDEELGQPEAHRVESPFGSEKDVSHVVETTTTTTVTRDFEEPEEESERVSEPAESPKPEEPSHVTEVERQEEAEPHLISETTTTITSEFYDEPASPAPSSHVESERPIAESPAISEKELPHAVETTTTTTVTREYEEESEKRSPSPADSQKNLVIETTTTVTREFYDEPEDQEQESQAHSPAPTSYVESEYEKPHVVETTTTTTVTRDFYEDEPHHEATESPAHREIAESPVASSPAPSSHFESERPVAESPAISEKELPHVVETTTTTTVTREFYEDEPHREVSESPAAHYFHEQPEHEAESPVPTEQAPLLAEQPHPEHDDDESDGEGFGSKMLGFAKKAGMVAGAVVAAPVALAAVGAKSAYEALKRDDGEEDEEEQEALLRDVREQRAPESPAASDKDVPQFEQEYPITHSPVPSEPAEQEPVQESPISSEPHHVTETTTTTTVTREFYDEPESPVASEKEFHQPSESVGSPVESERSLPHVTETTTTTTVTREYFDDEPEAAREQESPVESERPSAESPTLSEKERHVIETTTTTTVSREFHDEPESPVGSEKEFVQQVERSIESPVDSERSFPDVVETTTTTTTTRDFYDDEPEKPADFEKDEDLKQFQGEESPSSSDKDQEVEQKPEVERQGSYSSGYSPKSPRGSLDGSDDERRPVIETTTTTTTVTRDVLEEQENPEVESTEIQELKSPVESEKSFKEGHTSPSPSEKVASHLVETTMAAVTRELFEPEEQQFEQDLESPRKSPYEQPTEYGRVDSHDIPASPAPSEESARRESQEAERHVVETTTTTTITREYGQPEEDSERVSEPSESPKPEEPVSSSNLYSTEPERPESPVYSEKDTYSSVPVTEAEHQEEGDPHLISETATTTTVTREFYDEPVSPTPSSHVESEHPIAESPAISEKELPHVVETTTTTTVTREYEEEPEPFAEERSPSPADSQKHLVTETTTTTTVTRDLYDEPEEQDQESHMASSPAPSSHVESERPVAESPAISEKDLSHVVETTTTTTVTREFYEDEPHQEVSESPAAHYFHEQSGHETESPVPTEQAPLLAEQAHPEHDDDESDGEGFGSKMLGFAKKAGMVAGAVVAAPVALAAVGAKSAYDALKRDDGEEDEEEQEALLRDVRERQSPAASDKDVPQFEQEYPITHSPVPSEPAEQGPVQESPVSSEPHHVTETTTTTTVTREFYDEPESPVASEKEFHQPSESVGSPVESERSLPHVTETTTTTTVTREYFDDEPEAAHEQTRYSPAPSSHVESERPLAESPTHSEKEGHVIETTTTTSVTREYHDDEPRGESPAPSEKVEPVEATTTMTREVFEAPEGDEPEHHYIEKTTTTTVTRELYGEEEPEQHQLHDVPKSPATSEHREEYDGDSEEPHIVETTTTTVTRQFYEEPEEGVRPPSGSEADDESHAPRYLETTTTTTVTREYEVSDDEEDHGASEQREGSPVPSEESVTRVVEKTTTTTVTEEHFEPEESHVVESQEYVGSPVPSEEESHGFIKTTTTNTTVTREHFEPEEELVHHEGDAPSSPVPSEESVSRVVETTTTTVVTHEQFEEPHVVESQGYSATGSPVPSEKSIGHVVETTTTTTVTREHFEPGSQEYTSGSPVPSENVEEPHVVESQGYSTTGSPVPSEKSVGHVVETTTTTTVTREHFEEEPEAHVVESEKYPESPLPSEESLSRVVETTTTTVVTHEQFEEPHVVESQEYSATGSPVPSEKSTGHVVETTTTVTREHYEPEETGSPVPSDEVSHGFIKTTTTTTTTTVRHEPEDVPESPVPSEKSRQESPSPVPSEKVLARDFHEPVEGDDEESDGEGFGSKMLGFAKKAGMVAGAVVAAPVALAAVGAKSAYDALKKDDEEEKAVDSETQEPAATFYEPEEEDRAIASTEDVKEEPKVITPEESIKEFARKEASEEPFVIESEEYTPVVHEEQRISSPVHSDSGDADAEPTEEEETQTAPAPSDAPFVIESEQYEPVVREEQRISSPAGSEGEGEGVIESEGYQRHQDEPFIVESEEYIGSRGGSESGSPRPFEDSTTTTVLSVHHEPAAIPEPEVEEEELFEDKSVIESHEYTTGSPSPTTVTTVHHVEPRDYGATSPTTVTTVESEYLEQEPHVVESEEYRGSPVYSDPRKEFSASGSPVPLEKSEGHVLETTTTTTTVTQEHFEPEGHVIESQEYSGSPVLSEKESHEFIRTTTTTTTVTRKEEDAPTSPVPSEESISRVVETTTTTTVTREHFEPEEGVIESREYTSGSPVSSERIEEPHVVESREYSATGSPVPSEKSVGHVVETTTTVTREHFEPEETHEHVGSPVPSEEESHGFVKTTTTTTTVTREHFEEEPEAHVVESEKYPESPVPSEEAISRVVETTTTTTVTREHFEPEEGVIESREYTSGSPAPSEEESSRVIETTTTVTHFEEPNVVESQEYSATGSPVPSEKSVGHVVETTTTTTVTREHFEEDPEAHVVESEKYPESPVPSEESLSRVVETTTTTVTREHYEPEETQSPVPWDEESHGFIKTTTTTITTTVRHEPEDAPSPTPSEEVVSKTLETTTTTTSTQEHFEPEQHDDDSDGEGFGSKMLGFAKKAGMVAGAVVAAPVALAAVGAKSAYDALKRDGEEEESSVPRVEVRQEKEDSESEGSFVDHGEESARQTLPLQSTEAAFMLSTEDIAEQTAEKLVTEVFVPLDRTLIESEEFRASIESLNRRSPVEQKKSIEDVATEALQNVTKIKYGDPEEEPEKEEEEDDEEWKVYDRHGEVLEEFSTQLTDDVIQEAEGDATTQILMSHADYSPRRSTFLKQESCQEISNEPEVDYYSDLQEKLRILAGEKSNLAALPEEEPSTASDQLDVIHESDQEEAHRELEEQRQQEEAEELTAMHLVDQVLEQVVHELSEEENEDQKTMTSDAYLTADSKDGEYDTCVTSQDDTYESAQGWTSQDSEYTTATSQPPSRLSDDEDGEHTARDLERQETSTPQAMMSPVDSDRHFTVQQDFEMPVIRAFDADDFLQSTARSTPDVALQVTIEEEDESDDKLPISPSGVLLPPKTDPGRPVSPVPPRRGGQEQEGVFVFVREEDTIAEPTPPPVPAHELDAEEQKEEEEEDVTRRQEPERIHGVAMEASSDPANSESSRYSRQLSDLSSSAESHADTVIRVEGERSGSSDSLEVVSVISAGKSLTPEDPEAKPVVEEEDKEKQHQQESENDEAEQLGFEVYDADTEEQPLQQPIEELETVEEEPEDSDSLNEGNGSGHSSVGVPADTLAMIGKYRHQSSDNLSLTSLQEFERLEKEVGARGDGSLTRSEIELLVAGRLNKSGEGSVSSLAEFERLEKELVENQSPPEDVMMLSDIREESEAEDMSIRDDDEDVEGVGSDTELKSRPVQEEDLRAITPIAPSPTDSLEQAVDPMQLQYLETSTDSLEPTFQEIEVEQRADSATDTSLAEYEMVPRVMEASITDSLDGTATMEKDSVLEGASQGIESTQSTHGLLSGDTLGTLVTDDDKDSLDGEVSSLLQSYPTTLTTFQTTVVGPDGTVQTISRRVETRVTDPLVSHVQFTGTESQERLDQLPDDQQFETVDTEGNVTRTTFRREHDEPPHY